MGLRIIGYGREEPPVNNKLKAPDGGSCEIFRKAPKFIAITGDALEGYRRNIVSIDAAVDNYRRTTSESPGDEADRPSDYSGRTADLPGILEIVRRTDSSDRSKDFFKVVKALQKKGWTAGEIEALFDDYPNGIASKYWDRLRQEVDRVFRKTADDGKFFKEPPPPNLGDPAPDGIPLITPGAANACNPIKLLSYDEMVALQPTDWAIDGLLPRRSKSVLFGESDSFKSFFAVDVNCSVSTGRSWHGHAVKRCRAIYVANEGANAIGRQRVPAWMAYHEIPADDRKNIFLVKAETILPNETSRANLLLAVRTIIEPDEDFLLTIDVLRGTMTGSESDDEAAHAWTRAAEILIAEGATLLTVTHSPYGEADRMRGHTHLWGSFDTRLHAEGDKEKLTAVLKVNRHKDHDSSGQWGFKLELQEVPNILAKLR